MCITDFAPREMPGGTGEKIWTRYKLYREGEEEETLQRDEKINYNNMDGVEFPKIVWQGWKNADTSKFDNYRVKMVEDNPEWKFNLVTNEEQEKFLRETDDEIVQLAYKSFQLLNRRTARGQLDAFSVCGVVLSRRHVFRYRLELSGF